MKDPELKAALLGQKAEQSAGKGTASKPRTLEVSGSGIPLGPELVAVMWRVTAEAWILLLMQTKQETSAAARPSAEATAAMDLTMDDAVAEASREAGMEVAASTAAADGKEGPQAMAVDGPDVADLKQQDASMADDSIAMTEAPAPPTAVNAEHAVL